MARRETHIEDCMRLLGAEFNDVHAWLDQWAAKFPPTTHLEYHRKFLHHRKGVEECRKLFGLLDTYYQRCRDICNAWNWKTI